MKVSRGAKVFVAMSGGVDSSVTAALLKKGGFDVEGVYLNLLPGGAGGELPAVKKVAEKIGIPLRVIDARREFGKKVLDYFTEEYRRGKTPNPCVVCNQYIKFGLLMDKALGKKEGYLATGHYARIRIAKSGGTKKYGLLRGKDKIKDQSYFLYRLTQDKSRRILFPVGNYRKTEVKKMAAVFGLPCENKESRDFCFLKSGGLRSFLARKIRMKKGPIKTLDNKTIGEHEGLPFYTIGQRSGLNIGGTGPYYVAGFNMRKNILWVVGDKDNAALYSWKASARKVSWISGKPPVYPVKCRVKVRYNHPGAEASVRVKNGRALIEFASPQWAVTPGQSAVFYRGEEVLGGGVIM